MIVIEVKVKQSAGAYEARVGRYRASSAMGALQAVERVAGKWQTDHRVSILRDPVCVSGPDSEGREVWAFRVEEEKA